MGVSALEAKTLRSRSNESTRFCSRLRCQAMENSQGVQKWSQTAISSSVDTATRILGYSSLKDKQKEAIITFLSGNDVFVALPTGYGKSLCYGCLPGAFDILRKTEKMSIVIVISPLISLMNDQVSSFSSKGVSAAFINEASSHEMKLGVLSGDYQLVFFSPESLLSRKRWGELLRHEPYSTHLVALIVDEAHCVKKW